jgi:hypothetical protein
MLVWGFPHILATVQDNLAVALSWQRQVLVWGFPHILATVQDNVAVALSW